MLRLKQATVAAAIMLLAMLVPVLDNFNFAQGGGRSDATESSWRLLPSASAQDDDNDDEDDDNDDEDNDDDGDDDNEDDDNEDDDNEDDDNEDGDDDNDDGDDGNEDTDNEDDEDNDDDDGDNEDEDNEDDDDNEDEDEDDENDAGDDDNGEWDDEDLDNEGGDAEYDEGTSFSFDASVTEARGRSTGGDSRIGLPADRVLVRMFPWMPMGIEVVVRVLDPYSAPSPPCTVVGDLIFQLEAYDASGYGLGQLPAEVNLSARYTNRQAAGLNRANVTMFWLDPYDNQWKYATKLVTYSPANYVAASVTGLGTYAVCVP